MQKKKKIEKILIEDGRTSERFSHFTQTHMEKKT